MKLLGRFLLLLAGFGLLALLVQWPGEEDLPPFTAPLRSHLEGSPQPLGLSAPAPPGRAPKDSSDFPIMLPSGLRVSGSVYDEAGTRLAGARVTLIGPDAVPREIWTDDEGRFAFQPLPEGAWQLLCRLSGFRDLRQSLDPPDGADSPDPDHLDLRLVLHPAPHLRVKILTSGGSPLLAELGDVFPTDPFRVMASLRRPGRLLPPSVFEDPTRLGSGFWMPPMGRRREFREFASGYEGILFLAHPLPVHVSLLLYQHVLASQQVAPGTDEVVFTVDPQAVRSLLGSVRLHLVDAGKGDPPAWASIRLASVDRLQDSFPAESDGDTVFENLLPGPYILTVEAPGLESIYKAFTLPPGEDLDLGDFSRQSGGILRVCAVDADGAPVPKATLALEESLPGTSWRPFGVGPFRHADPQGCFRIALGPRRILLRLEAPGRAPAVFPIENLAGSPSSRTVVLREGIPVALEPSLEPGEQRFLFVRTESGQPVLSRVAEGTTPVLIRLLPGSYVCVQHDLAGREDAKAFQVGGAGLHVALPN